MKYLILILLFISCHKKRELKDPKEFYVNMKYCISVCMNYEFHRFHSKGESWGAGSSSMNGLSQKSIYDRVKQECIEFYKDEKCCKWNREYTGYNNIDWFHSTKYGACK